MSAVSFRAVRDFAKVHGGHERKHYDVYETHVLELDDHRCHYCGSTGSLTMDHVVPKSLGGSDHYSNLVAACRTCNSSKRTKSYEDFLEFVAADMVAYEMMMTTGDCL
ncbi:HNH endonuclease [Loktanella sp. R86503]|uniref:HNH endonuclease n=1 Tax=Loktanella sp. R86503 TaxID=3093847 RepID=UPI0036DF0F34